MKQIVEHVVKSGGKVENDSGFHAAILERIKARDPEGAGQDEGPSTASEGCFRTVLNRTRVWTRFCCGHLNRYELWHDVKNRNSRYYPGFPDSIAG